VRAAPVASKPPSGLNATDVTARLEYDAGLAIDHADLAMSGDIRKPDRVVRRSGHRRATVRAESDRPDSD
jgi:hypothetical protein